MSTLTKPAMKQPPAHGTPARYRGGRRKDGSEWEPCRCRVCSARHSEEYRRAKARRAGLAEPPADDIDDPEQPAAPAERGGGETERAVRADLGALGDEEAPWRRSLAAVAVALAREIDGARLTSVAPSARQLREVLAAIRPMAAEGSGDDPEEMFGDDGGDDWGEPNRGD